MNEFEIELAIEQLVAVGLVARKATGAIAGIIGGVGENEDSAIILYKDAFSIYLEKNGKWTVRHPGLGQLVREVECASLDEAVKVILSTYAGKSS